MNYLAHAYLSDGTPESLVGNLMADFLKGRIPDDLPVGVRCGVLLHRRVDAFTDAHPVTARTRARLRPRWGKLSGVLADMFYDHLLAADWERYSPDQSLRVFADGVYDSLATQTVVMPDRMRIVMGKIAERDGFVYYSEIDGLREALARMSRRLKRARVALDEAADDLVREYDAFADDFHAFFPDLISSVPQMNSEVTDLMKCRENRRP